MVTVVNPQYNVVLFVELVTEESEIEICSLGSCTCSRKDLAKGVEVDDCWAKAVRRWVREELDSGSL
jgi:hypothetical protein